jgi:hypothetical protein
MTKILRPLFLAVIAASLTLAGSLYAAIPPAENLLPSDTLLVFSVPDSAALRTTLHGSPQWLLWNDPAMKPFHDKFMGKWNETFVAPLEKDLGLKLADFAALPQGQFTFAITQNGWTGTGDQVPGTVLLLDAKDKSDLLKTNLAALQKKWSDAGKSIRTETIRDVKFSIVPMSSNDVPASLSGMFPKQPPASELGKDAPPEKPSEIVVGQFESLLIVGNSIKAVQPVVEHLTGGAAPALNDNPVFAADKLAQFHDAPLYFGWFNAKTFFTVLSQIPQPEPNPDAPSPMPQIPWNKSLAASGAMGLKSAGFAYREPADGSQVNFYLSVPEAERTGLFKIIAAAPKDANPPVFVPADAVKFWRWRVDGQKDWAALETMVGGISPAALSSLNAAIAMANASAQQKDPSFDIRKNLLGNLGDDFMGYGKAPTGSSLADLNNAPSIFLFAAPNPDLAVNAVNSIASLIYGRQGANEPRDFLGKKIYNIPLPAPRGAAATAPAHSLYLTTANGYVAISGDSGMVESFLRSTGSPGKPLRETAGLTEAAQHIGGAGGGLFGYENNREIMRSTFTLLKNSSDSATGLGPMAALPKNFRDWMDFSLLPDYDQVSKYFYFSVFGGSTTVDGISFKAFAPRPPQVK